MTPSLEHVAAYLTARGWAVSGQWRNAKVWSRSEFDVLVPRDDTAPDTPQRLHELVRCVADAEGRSPQAIWLDISWPAADTISYQTPESAATLSLPAGHSILEALRDVLTISATESLTGNQIPPGAVRRLLDRSVLTPGNGIIGLDIRLPLGDDPDLLGRKTALRVLHNSATVLRVLDAVDSTPNPIPAEGIPPAFCTALAALAGPEHRAPSN